MLGKILQAVLFTALFNNTIERNVQTRTMIDLKKILNTINDNQDNRNDVTYLRTKNRHQSLRNQDNDNADRIDVDILDSFIKRILNNNNKFNDQDFDRFLRNAKDNLCAKTGRCGCSGPGRCDDKKVTNQKTVDEVENFINNLQEKLEKDNQETSSDDETENDIQNNDKILQDNDKEDDEYYNIKIDDKKQADTRVNLLIVNDLADLEDLLRQNILPQAIDAETIKKLNFDNFPHHGVRHKSRNNVKAIIVDLGKFYNDSEMGDNEEDLTVPRSEAQDQESSDPNEFIDNFNHLKEKVINSYINFVTNKNAKKPNLSVLSNTQKRKIRILKGKMRTNKQKLSKQDIKTEINDIMFGKNSKIKFIPTNDNSNNIAVPNWIYKLIVNSKPVAYLREPKRVLPLTEKQKNRLFNKNKSLRQKPEISRIWRRNFGQNLQQLGVPFELAVEGLAQYNDDNE
ncbi:PREDICTED: MATH and LRR domain-containing protein PFE0570w-like [Papilio xuthus]|uniref:MATH and LRR domain-containing protein PFE0570w-like n=1 Tax=Papilio xuthus TaxID=66420 RepID=A0AAJ6Z4W2_PAPXU|nr:PREDICTED: MATH and LRR domain-containing protein PFE0570w-like [Papilio xuthus]